MAAWSRGRLFLVACTRHTVGSRRPWSFNAKARSHPPSSIRGFKKRCTLLAFPMLAAKNSSSTIHGSTILLRKRRALQAKSSCSSGMSTAEARTNWLPPSKIMKTTAAAPWGRLSKRRERCFSLVVCLYKSWTAFSGYSGKARRPAVAASCSTEANVTLR
ncbi:unnamed protein product [Prorocentrum cordatum]|uniref:Secreted protein n=1 Tax=Prorocentrum cordatum TaxID=2364126 RepID=A0ABN9X7W4_9DINO|nr:unnamed protein product [Polarella glacialis]